MSPKGARRRHRRPLTARKNRRLRRPLWARVPGPRTIGRALAVGVRRAIPVALALALISGVGASGYFGCHFLTTADRFAISEVDIRGNQLLPDSRIRDRLALGEHTNIFALDLTALERELERDPWIARAELRRELPDRLVVDLVENQAVALVNLDGLYLTDRDGHLFKRAAIDRGEGIGLPVITGLDRKKYLADPAHGADEIRRALAAAELYHALPSRARLGEIHLDPRLGISFFTYDGGLAIRVGHGSPEQLEQRLRTFDAAWAALDAATRAAALIVYVDNTTRPDRVTVGF